MAYREGNSEILRACNVGERLCNYNPLASDEDERSFLAVIQNRVGEGKWRFGQPHEEGVSSKQLCERGIRGVYLTVDITEEVRAKYPNAVFVEAPADMKEDVDWVNPPPDHGFLPGVF